MTGRYERVGWTCEKCNLKKEGTAPEQCPNCGSSAIWEK